MRSAHSSNSFRGISHCIRFLRTARHASRPAGVNLPNQPLANQTGSTSGLASIADIVDRSASVAFGRSTVIEHQSLKGGFYRERLFRSPKYSLSQRRSRPRPTHCKRSKSQDSSRHHPKRDCHQDQQQCRDPCSYPHRKGHRQREQRIAHGGRCVSFSAHGCAQRGTRIHYDHLPGDGVRALDQPHHRGCNVLGIDAAF